MTLFSFTRYLITHFQKHFSKVYELCSITTPFFCKVEANKNLEMSLGKEGTEQTVQVRYKVFTSHLHLYDSLENISCQIIFQYSQTSLDWQPGHHRKIITTYSETKPLIESDWWWSFTCQCDVFIFI